MILASRPHYQRHLEAVGPVPDDVALVASYADVVAAARTGRRVVRMEHGIGQSYSDTNPGYPGGDDHDDVSLFLTPNEHSAGRWRSRYPHAAVEVVGAPRLDHLLVRVPDGRVTVAVSFHWRTGSVPEARHALAWYLGVIGQLPFHVIGHGHPRNTRLPAIWARRGIRYVPDFDDVCREADVYVCDNSSTLYEFASTGRPVVVMDAPWYRRDVDHGLRFWDAADVGVRVSDPGDLAAGIERALEERTEDTERRERALDIVYAYRTGAAERIRALL